MNKRSRGVDASCTTVLRLDFRTRDSGSSLKSLVVAPFRGAFPTLRHKISRHLRGEHCVSLVSTHFLGQTFPLRFERHVPSSIRV